MNLKRLRARLDAVEKVARPAFGTDLCFERKRRTELFYLSIDKRRAPKGLTAAQQAERDRLDDLFRDEDDRRGRCMELTFKHFEGLLLKGVGLTEAEQRERSELRASLPPLYPEGDPLQKAFDHFSRSSPPTDD